MMVQKATNEKRLEPCLLQKTAIALTRRLVYGSPKTPISDITFSFNLATPLQPQPDESLPILIDHPNSIGPKGTLSASTSDELHLIPIPQTKVIRRTRTGAPYITDLPEERATRVLRSTSYNDPLLLMLPYCSRYDDITFSVYIPWLWNSLPTEVKTLCCFVTKNTCENVSIPGCVLSVYNFVYTYLLSCTYFTLILHNVFTHLLSIYFYLQPELLPH